MKEHRVQLVLKVYKVIQGIQGITGASGSASGGIADIYNNNIRYIIDQGGSDYTLELTSTGDEWGGRSWNRVSTTLYITSSAHGLSNGDVVMVRNAGGQDYVLSAIANSSANNFSVTVADSGGFFRRCFSLYSCFFCKCN